MVIQPLFQNAAVSDYTVGSVIKHQNLGIGTIIAITEIKEGVNIISIKFIDGRTDKLPLESVVQNNLIIVSDSEGNIEKKVYYSPDEWAVVQKKSAHCGMRPGTYIRIMSVQGEIKFYDNENYKMLINAVRSVSNNINQIPSLLSHPMKCCLRVLHLYSNH